VAPCGGEQAQRPLNPSLGLAEQDVHGLDLGIAQQLVDATWGGGASGYSRAAQAGADPECRRRSDYADPAHSDVA
jgi:hypothetical protein